MSAFITTGLFLLASNFFYIDKPVVTMREFPKEDSEVVSQAIFSEEVSLAKEEGDWAFISTPDGCSGWVKKESFIKLSKPYETSCKTSRFASHVYGIKDTVMGPLLTLPYGVGLQVLDRSDVRWAKVAIPDGREYFIQKGDIMEDAKLTKKEELVAFSKRFLGLPYTWGGRSSFGYDCSGFVQMLYNQIGISLQRDAKLQINDKRFRPIAIEDLEPGDLLFFGKSSSKILHVGMYIGDGQFIQATVKENMPWIRISSLKDQEWMGLPNANDPFRTARQLIK